MVGMETADNSERGQSLPLQKDFGEHKWGGWRERGGAAPPLPALAFVKPLPFKPLVNQDIFNELAV